MSKEFQIRDGNLIASFDLENGDGDIDFCKLLKVSQGVVEEIGMFVDYVSTNKIIKDQSKKIADLEAKLAEKEKKIEYQESMKILAVKNQNQKAIAELEKLRKQLDCEDNYCYGDNNIVICINRTIFNNIIDNQINGLKGEK